MSQKWDSVPQKKWAASRKWSIINGRDISMDSVSGNWLIAMTRALWVSKLSCSLESVLNSCNRCPKEVFTVCLEVMVAGLNPVSVDCDERVQFILDRTDVKMAGGVDLDWHWKGCKHRLRGRKRYILIGKAWVPLDVRINEAAYPIHDHKLEKWEDRAVHFETEWQDKTILHLEHLRASKINRTGINYVPKLFHLERQMDRWPGL